MLYLMMVFFTELASRIKENEQRKGRRKLLLYEFLDIAAARHRTYARTSTSIPRQLEGFLRMMSVHIKRLQEIVPDFTTIWWSKIRTKINLNPKVNLEREDI